MPVGDRFQVLADSIIGLKNNESAIMQARALYDYVTDNMKYIKAGKYGTGDAVYACDALTGNCTEFHSPVDISEANKYSALATYYFGRHPANRIEFSRGRDLLIEPGPQIGPINFLAYPVMEIGKTPAFPETFFSFRRKAEQERSEKLVILP